MSIAQIVLSDLHLGARDSLLAHVNGADEIADGPSEVLARFANALRISALICDKSFKLISLISIVSVSASK